MRILWMVIACAAMEQSPATPGYLQRLSEAIRFRTVTIQSARPREDPAFGEFRGLVRHLRTCYPLLAERARWEETPSGAQLLTLSPAEDAGIRPMLFSTHTDVVPPGEESLWAHGPFSGDLADGFVWGRGCLDDKGPLMALFEAAESLLAEGFLPSRVVYFAVGCDEETVGSGAVEMARTLADRGVRLAAVFDEGSVVLRTVRRPVAAVGIAEKGYLDLRIRVKGDGGHSSMPRPHTSAGVLAAALARLERHPPPPRLHPVVHRFLKTMGRSMPGIQGWVVRHARPLWPLVRGLLAADRTVNAQLRTTRAVTVVTAGVAANVIPVESEATVNVRILPGDTVRKAAEAVRRLVRQDVPSGFAVRVATAATPAREPVPPSATAGQAWEAVVAALEQAVPDVEVTPFLTPGMTDSRSYAGMADGIYRILPLLLTREDLGLIHGANERISLDNYDRMIGYYRDLIRRVAG